MGMVGRSPSFGGWALFFSCWVVFLVWYQDRLRGDGGRCMGPTVFNFRAFLFDFSAINVAFFRLEYVDSKDASVRIFVILNYSRSTFLEIT